MGEGRSHFAHQGNAIPVSHLFALMLQLKVGLFLRANVQSHSDRLQKISFLVRQTAAAHDYPPRFPIWQKEAVFAFKRPGKSAGTIISRFDVRSLVGLDTGKK